MNRRRLLVARGAQRGMAALEFAMLFPVFFLICYGIVTYGLLFAAQQTLTLAAEEGARAAQAYQPANNMSAALALRRSTACSTATGVLPALTAHASCTASVGPCGYNSGSLQWLCIQVAVTFNYRAQPFVATLPGVPVPSALTGTATAQLNPATLIGS
jgi:Flp pilus assembly protein TadG